MEFKELIRTRYSCRKYSSQSVPDEKLMAVLEAGRIAPTGHNCQPQRILVVKDGTPEMELLRQCTACHFNAPVVLIACFEHVGRDHVYEDLAIVMTHIMLACYDEGLVNLWVQMVDRDKLRELFHIPGRYHILGLMPIGYPREDAKPSRLHNDRKALEETVFFDRFPD